MTTVTVSSKVSSSQKQDHIASLISSLSLILGKHRYGKRRVPLSAAGWKSWLSPRAPRALRSDRCVRRCFFRRSGCFPPWRESRGASAHAGTAGRTGNHPGGAGTVPSTGTVNKQKIIAGSFQPRTGASVWPASVSGCQEKSVFSLFCRAAAVNMTCLNVSFGQMPATMQLTNSTKTDYLPSSCLPFLGLTDKSFILKKFRQL